MFTAARVRRRGFTLIELLVVVAIIALLISILLPSLGRAREQGKTAKCLANLKGIMTTTHIYFLENNDRFPFVTKDSGGTLGICTWQFGGARTEKFWDTDSGGAFAFTAREKPFNRLMINSTSVEDDEKMKQFECPSDNFSHQRSYGDPKKSFKSSYLDVGTSYHYNLTALTDLRDQKGTLNRNTDGGYWYNKGEGWSRVGAALVRETRAGFSSRFAMIIEDPLDWGFANRIQTQGYHKVFSRHSIGFIDGHSENKSVDTRGYCGVGWTAINPGWVKTTDPPYQPDPWWYLPPKKNCDPPK